MIFETASPESTGIPSYAVKNFLTRLEKQQLPLHSAIIMRHGKICAETYYAPYNKDSLHRMFSITKSFVSMAIGCLAEEGKLKLDDKIVDYFPEKQPESGTYKYTAMLTIRDMLKMKTCHTKTTYKNPGVTDWVGSFFTTKPNHVPGTVFSYDTSSTHVLGALVEKLSGMTILDYLRSKGLDELGFSKDAHILTDPQGIEMGGSGMCASSRDILLMMMLIKGDGALNGRQYFPKDYVKAAKSLQSDTYGKQGTFEEMQGYGYQIWLTRNRGYVLFGMGGQLALYVPDKDIFMITTADAQGRQGGVQLIYDAFWDEIYSAIDSDSLPENKKAHDELIKYCESRTVMNITGSSTSSLECDITDKIYICDENECAVKSIQLNIDKTTHTGHLSIKNNAGIQVIDFGMCTNEYGIFPGYDLEYAASAAWRMEDYLLIKIQIIDSAVGNLYIGLSFKDSYITVMMRKTVEDLFNEYNGIFSGRTM